jgi:hypothetical protein
VTGPAPRFRYVTDNPLLQPIALGRAHAQQSLCVGLQTEVRRVRFRIREEELVIVYAVPWGQGQAQPVLSHVQIEDGIVK